LSCSKISNLNVLTPAFSAAASRHSSFAARAQGRVGGIVEVPEFDDVGAPGLSLDLGELGERGGAGRGDDFGGAETRDVLDGFFAGADISARYYDGFAREVDGRDGRFEDWLCVDFRRPFCLRSYSLQRCFASDSLSIRTNQSNR